MLAFPNRVLVNYRRLETHCTIFLKVIPLIRYNSEKYCNTIPIKNPMKTLTIDEVLEDLTNTHNFSLSDWQGLRNKLLTARIKYINANNVDASIVDLLGKKKEFIGAHNFYQSSSLHDSHIGILGKFLNVFGLEVREGGLHEKNKSLIFEIYKRIRNKSEILDPLTSEYCINAICSYEELWKDAVIMLNDIKLTSVPNSPVYNYAIQACFDFGENELGWNYVNELLECQFERFLYDSTILSYINSCFRTLVKDTTKGITDIEILYNFLSDNDIFLSSNVVDKLILLYETHGYMCKTVELNKCCKCCGLPLKEIVLSSEEYVRLRNTFAKDAVISSDVFYKTTPHEFSKFVDFVERTVPYDIVLDGLNIAFSIGSVQNKSQNSEILKLAVEYFKKKTMRVMIIGRKHMTRWPKKHMDYVQNNAALFLADDLSQDDPFLLYAALRSGHKTNIVTKDLLRNHLFNIKDKYCKQLFRRWVLSHRMELHFNYYTKNMSVKPPARNYFTAHKSSNKSNGHQWHVLYKIPEDTRILCISKK